MFVRTLFYIETNLKQKTKGQGPLTSLTALAPLRKQRVKKRWRNKHCGPDMTFASYLQLNPKDKKTKNMAWYWGFFLFRSLFYQGNNAGLHIRRPALIGSALNTSVDERRAACTSVWLIRVGQNRVRFFFFFLASLFFLNNGFTSKTQLEQMHHMATMLEASWG